MLNEELEFTCKEATHFIKVQSTKEKRSFNVTCQNNGDFEVLNPWPICVDNIICPHPAMTSDVVNATDLTGTSFGYENTTE